MKITFIYPAIGSKNHKPFTPLSRMEPLALAVLAGMTPPAVETVFYDDRLEPIDYDAPTDLVAMTVETFTAKRAYEIAGEFRKRGVPVILGGYHPTVLPQEALTYADSVVIGEAEGLWGEVVADAKNRRLKPVYRLRQQANLAGVKARRDIFSGKDYLKIALVNFSRGCKNACNFCAVGSFYTPSFNIRPLREVIDEVAGLDQKTVFFVDDNIAGDTESAKELFKLLIPLKKNWVGQVSINFINDDELLDVMVRSGCKGVLIGFESLNQTSLLAMDKICNIKIPYEIPLTKIRNHGILIWGSFLIGYDCDDPGIFNTTVEFAIKHKFCLASFNHLTPYPGTALYEKLEEEGRLLYEKWWLDPQYKFGHVAYKPKLMSPEELTAGCLQARSRFNSFTSVLRRGFDFRSNLGSPSNALLFFNFNAMSKKEYKVKQDMQLGFNESVYRGNT